MDYIVKSAPFDSTRNISVRPEPNHNIYQRVSRTRSNGKICLATKFAAAVASG